MSNKGGLLGGRRALSLHFLSIITRQVAGYVGPFASLCSIFIYKETHSRAQDCQWAIVSYPDPIGVTLPEVDSPALLNDWTSSDNALSPSDVFVINSSCVTSS